MRIRYQPRVGGHRVTVPYFAAGPEFDAQGNPTGAELRTWDEGQEREVPDDLRVRFNIANNAFGMREGRIQPQGDAHGPSTVRTVSAVDALLSIGPEFVDATTGKNPDFTCTECGELTTELYFHDPALATPGIDIDHDRGPETRVWYTTTGEVGGDKLCPRDFLARHPRYIPWHETVGADRRMTSEARNRAEDARIKAEQNARTAPRPQQAPQPAQPQAQPQPPAAAPAPREGT